MSSMRKFFLVVGRMFLAIIFLLAGVTKIFEWRGTEEKLIMTFSNWMNHVAHVDFLSATFEFLMPWAGLLLGIATFLEIAGGFLVFFGLAEKVGSVLLLIFLVPTTIIFHHFWFLEGAQHDLEMIMFLKNLGLIGGLMILLSTPRRRRIIQEHVS